MAVHHHSWSAGNDEDTCMYKEEPTSSQMLYDRIQQLSDRMHAELRPSQDDRHSSTYGSRHDEGHHIIQGDGDLTSDHSSRYSVDSREDISSRNSTLVDETSLNTTNGERDAVLRDLDSRELNSRALVAYSEVNESPLSNTRMEEQEHSHKNLEYNVGALGSDGEDRNSQHGSGIMSGDDVGGSDGGTRKPHVPTDDIDPKLYKALEKMRKLDEKLANVTKVS